MALRQPLGIVVIPDQTVSANSHAVSLREADDLIALAKIKCVGVSPHSPPLHRVLGLDHVVFARQGGGVRGFGKQGGTNRSAHQHTHGMRCTCAVSGGARRPPEPPEAQQRATMREQMRSFIAPSGFGGGDRRQERSHADMARAEVCGEIFTALEIRHRGIAP